MSIPFNDAIPAISVVGLSLRVPGSAASRDFWRQLVEGVDSVSRPTPESAIARGAPPAMAWHPDWISAAGRLDDIAGFDADFFGFTSQQVLVMDPQHRLLLELGHEALEDAGYDPRRFGGRIGVFSGIGMNSYLWNALLPCSELVESAGPDALMIGNDKGFGSTRLSYKLDLRGPNLCIDTACSTSLVAIHQARMSLLNHECDIALAGGVRIIVPHWSGDLFDEGGILARDGVCRAFDKRAAGTVSGSGGALLVLRRAGDDCRRDNVRALLLGTAINNDGASKISFTAPSVDGQANALAEALMEADVDAASIGYIETHGTGTPLGDQLELTALGEVYDEAGSGMPRCLIGSVKTNVGHLDVAAGAVGFAKTVLALEHGIVPPSLHYAEPNALLGNPSTRFEVNTEPRRWPERSTPRRAAVSSFGIGGTNAHAVLEQAPPALDDSSTPGPVALILSARTPTALRHMRERLADRLREPMAPNLSNVAFTLQEGRQAFAHRCAVVADTLSEAVRLLDAELPPTHLEGPSRSGTRPVLLFPGQGSHYVGMSRELRRRHAVFRDELARALSAMDASLRGRVERVLSDDGMDADPLLLLDTSVMQPALFAFEYALAQAWLVAGVTPVAVAGHSLGEYVGACLAGIFSLENALTLVSARGQAMQSSPEGAMLAVSLPADLATRRAPDCCLAAVNGPNSCVLAGTPEAIAHAELLLQEIGTRRLPTSRAFHSRLMDSVLGSFAEAVAATPRSAPKIDIISSIDGRPLDAVRALSDAYWVDQLRQPVRFDLIHRSLAAMDGSVAVEVGPSRQLGALLRRAGFPAARTVASCGDAPGQEWRTFLAGLGRAFESGIDIDWAHVRDGDEFHRIPLPTYPFERRHFWPESVGQSTAHVPLAVVPSAGGQTTDLSLSDEAQRVVLQVWSEVFGVESLHGARNFFDAGGDSLTASRLVSRLRQQLGIPFSVQALYATPDLESLIDQVRQRLLAPEAGDMPDASTELTRDVGLL